MTWKVFFKGTGKPEINRDKRNSVWLTAQNRLFGIGNRVYRRLHLHLHAGASVSGEFEFRNILL